MAETQLQPIADISRFCSQESGRYVFTEPAVVNGFAYATNGHVMVRVPTTEPNRNDENFPKTPDDILHNFESVNPIDWSSFQSVEIGECKDCAGSGLEGNECEECGGDGDVECEYGHEHRCPSCDGKGKTKPDDDCEECSTCKGSGKRYARSVLGSYVPGHLAELIDTLPSPRVVGVKKSKFGDNLGKACVVKFVFDGNGEGVVMCLGDKFPTD